MIRTGTFRYVPWPKIDEFHRAGWMIVTDLSRSHHSYWAALMWRCDCEHSS